MATVTAKKIGKVGSSGNLPSVLTDEGFEYVYDTGALHLIYRDPTTNELVRGKVKCCKNTMISISVAASDWVKSESDSTYVASMQLLFSGVIIDAEDILMCYPADTNSEEATLEIFECGVIASIDASTNIIKFTANALPTTTMVYVVEINGAT